MHCNRIPERQTFMDFKLAAGIVNYKQLIWNEYNL